VTHDQEEAQSLADKIIIMSDGRIQQSGSPMHIYDEPVNEFVAGFIGTPPMNFSRCQVHHRPGDGSYLVAADGFEIRADSGMFERLKKFPNDTEIKVGIRPERVALQFEPEAGLLVGAVHVIEPEGNDLVVSVRLGTSIWKVRTSKAEFGMGVKRDTPVHVRLDQTRLHLFDIQTGERIAQAPAQQQVV
jgi:multiple sugar transport system ATP-binding protein